MTSIAIATCLAAPALNRDDEAFVAVLRAAGRKVAAVPWNDEDADWASFDAVLIRSTWDYHTRYEEFLAWLSRLDALGVRTLNDSALLRWNSDKRYLLKLPEFGVEIAPTELARGAELEARLQARRGEELVVKPTISAGAWHTVRGVAGTPTFATAIAGLPARLDYLVQPFIPEVAAEGEWSLLFFGADLSHAVLKRPAEGDYRVQREFGGGSEASRPDEATIAAANRALGVVERLGFERPVYARIDGVRRGDRFLIMELELIEPFLFLSSSPGASERFAAAVLAASASG